jgi:hypothetical protein
VQVLIERETLDEAELGALVGAGGAATEPGAEARTARAPTAAEAAA